MIDLLAEYRLNLSPYNYVKNNPIFYVDLYGMQDTLRPMPEKVLPEVIIYAYRNSSRNSKQYQREFGLILYSKGGRNGTNPYAWGPWLDWDPIEYLGFHWRYSKRYYEKPGKPTYVEMTKRTTTRASETSDEDIQEKAGNNNLLIKNNVIVKRYWVREKVKAIPIAAKDVLLKTDKGYHMVVNGVLQAVDSTTIVDTMYTKISRWYYIYDNGDTVYSGFSSTGNYR